MRTGAATARARGFATRPRREALRPGATGPGRAATVRLDAGRRRCGSKVGRGALRGRGRAATSRAGRVAKATATGRLGFARRGRAATGRPADARRGRAAGGHATRTRAGARGMAIARRVNDVTTLPRRGATAMLTGATVRGPRARTAGEHEVRVRAAGGVRTRAPGAVRARGSGGVRTHAVPMARGREAGGDGTRTRAGRGARGMAIARRVSDVRTPAHGETGARATAATGSDRRMRRDGVPVAGGTAKRGLRTPAMADRAGTSRPNLGPAVDGLARGGLVRPGIAPPGIAPPGLVRPEMERRGMFGHREPGGMAAAVQADRGSVRLTRLAGCLRFRQGSRPTSLTRRPRPS